MLPLLQYLAVIAAASFGVLLARSKGFDLVGVCSIAFVVAFGGGTLRDVLLDRSPLFWIAEEHYAWTVALTRMISAVFRRGGDVTFVVEELKAVFDPRGGFWSGGRYTPSILAAIGEVIERHMREIGFIEHKRATSEEASSAPGARGLCPHCGSAALAMIEGCATCGDCGYSRCG